MASIIKKTPRPERMHSRCRVVSLAFPAGIAAVGEKSFVPNADYMKLARKYHALVARRRREINRRAAAAQQDFPVS